MFKQFLLKFFTIYIVIFLIFLASGLILFKSPLKNTEFSMNAKSVVKNALNSTKDLFDSSNITFKDDKEMILTFSKDEFKLYSLLPDKNILSTKFSKKSWGPWNILGWYILTRNSKFPSYPFLVAGGDSNWEYVLRVANNPKDNFVFSGGNHKRELLKSITLTNPSDNSVIKFDNDKNIRLNQLKIEEVTCLTYDGSEKSKYAEVKRTYLVSPSKIELKTNFEFTSDILMKTSYVCMIPVSKKFGKYVLFKESGNIYTTPSRGKTLTTKNFENFLGKEASTTVEIWGDSNPSYKLITSIRDREMVDNFKNELKTFYWDLNKYDNKLYFSKFDIAKATKVTKGSKWENYCQWSIEPK